MVHKDVKLMSINQFTFKYTFWWTSALSGDAVIQNKNELKLEHITAFMTGNKEIIFFFFFFCGLPSVTAIVQCWQSKRNVGGFVSHAFYTHSFVVYPDALYVGDFGAHSFFAGKVVCSARVDTIVYILLPVIVSDVIFVI